jgi:adenylate cyclase class 2
MEEIEVKFLNINVEKIENKLKELGAVKKFDLRYKRRVFDYPDYRLSKNKHAWVRLRDEGDSVHLTYKERQNAGKTAYGDSGMKEIDLIVDDFKKTGKLLLEIGLIEKFYEENRRIRYIFENIEFDLDYWPLIPPFLEIEAKSWEDIDKAIGLLKLNQADQKRFSTMQVYKLYGIDENDYKVLTFQEIIKKK